MSLPHAPCLAAGVSAQVRSLKVLHPSAKADPAMDGDL